jgi:hypothetical protein
VTPTFDGYNAHAALVVAHPGHELRVHGWLEAAHPLVFVLTDGSGRTACSRLHSTVKVLQEVGTTSGSIFGALSDRELYAAILNHNYSPFISFVEELASTLLCRGIEAVAGDAREGYNPAHDVCRLIVNAAVKIVNRVSNINIANYDFTLIGRSDDCADELRGKSIWIHLDEESFARKLSAARNYQALGEEVNAALEGSGSLGLRRHPELAHLVDADVRNADVNSFRVECLRPVNCSEPLDYLAATERPFYEYYGEKQVLAGHYGRVLRYREHILPLAEILNSYAEGNRSCAHFES